ncbi:MAG TPA: Ig-like domain-containing protein [Bacteroidales bacterium]
MPRLFLGIAVLSLLILIAACAVQSPISGGKKDIIPPSVVSSVPANFSTGFTGQRIIISFNEFATLKDIEKQMLISPPVANEPDFKMRGKSLIISFKEPLQKDATYSVYMGNAIVDITEGNPLTDYAFVFSTGNKIDSLGFNGSVLDAIDQTPPKDALAMLYNGSTDSLPYLSRPLYVARVNDSTGDFKFQNLREGNFKLIVLQDQNSNFLYDKGEAIAFADTLILAHHVDIPKLDSLGKPIHIVDKDKFKKSALAMFHESDSVQRILRTAMVAPNHMQLALRLPVKSPKLKKFVADTLGAWYVSETNATRDTLNFWLKNIHSDSLHFILSDGSRVLDTLNISLAFKTKNAQKADRQGIKPKLRLKTNIPQQGNFPLHTQLMLVSDNPLKKADFSSFKLVEDSTTLRPKVQFLDSLKRRIIIKKQLLEATQYQLIIPDSVFEDIYGMANDSISIKFKTRALADYGSLTLKIHFNIPKPHIIQLLTDAGKVIQENMIEADGKISYPFLLPGKYKVKAIVDNNHNGKWDTGNYLRHIQPEKIIVFPKVLDLRGNWEQEEDWQL